MRLHGEDFISYAHLHVAAEYNFVVYINYMLCLTKTEYLIARLLAQRAGRPISAEKIAKILGITSGARGVTGHIHSINKKAFDIGQRKLILNSAKIGYFLNEEM